MEPRPLSERQATIRSALREALRDGPFTARELSARLGIPEKDVGHHLEHLTRSLRQTGDRLEVEPSRCLACGFTFKDRARLSRPSRCPRCKGERLSSARYRIISGR
jgi:transcriptional regulator